MPNNIDDVIVVLPNIRVGSPIASSAAHRVTPEDLDEIVKAAQVLGQLERVSACPSVSSLVWRGTAGEKQFVLWLLRQFADPPATNWIEPISALFFGLKAWED